MLVIKNIESMAGKYIGHWKINNISIGNDIYYIKVIHNGSPFDCFNLMIDRCRTSHGDYRVSCIETNVEHYLPIESIRDKDEFVSFLIYNLI